MVLNEDAVQCRLVRDDIRFTITAAHTVLEYFIEIENCQTGCKFHDWCDYRGFDNRPFTELAIDMEKDVLCVMEDFESKAFRLVEKKGIFSTKYRFEWYTDGEWRLFP